MSVYDLPTSLTVGGVDYEIRSDFRPVLDILIAENDPNLDDRAKTEVLLKIMYPGWRKIPPEYMEEAAKRACEFIDNGHKPDGKKRPKMVDWEKDAQLIFPAVNSIAKSEVRAVPYIHWWTFLGWFMSIGESTFSQVLSIRDKKARNKDLSKPEKEWYQRNWEIVDLQMGYTTEEDEIIKEWFSTGEM